MLENDPTIREIVLEPVYLAPNEAVEIDAVPLLDQTGNLLRDQDGRVLYV